MMIDVWLLVLALKILGIALVLTIRAIRKARRRARDAEATVADVEEYLRLVTEQRKGGDSDDDA